MPAQLHSQFAYDKLKEIEPDTKNTDGRLQWLIWKKHYGPISVEETLELTRLRSEHNRKLKALQEASGAST